jgi:nucleotide-binding universal stress UspA family protein
MSESRLPQSVLVGIDHSPTCLDAFRMGLWLHRRLGASVEALHVVDLPDPESMAGRPDTIALAQGEALEGAARQLEDRVARVMEEMMITDLTLTDVLRVTRGKPSKALSDRAVEMDADLVVIGPHQKRGWMDLGSTARDVLAKAPKAVWVQPGLPREPRRIVVPTDLSDHATAAVELGAALARKWHTDLTILFAYTPAAHAVALTPGFGASTLPAETMQADRDWNERQFREYVDGLDLGDVEAHPVFVDGFAAEAILARQADHDLIVMGSHGRTGLTGAVLGNVALRVVQRAHVPVLALRAPDAFRQG